jgi:hypothetical protein
VVGIVVERVSSGQLDCANLASWTCKAQNSMIQIKHMCFDSR